MFKDALHRGKNPQDIKDDRLRNYLMSKRRNCYVKLYNNYVFIYSKTGKQLYTMYKVPDKYLGSREDD